MNLLQMSFSGAILIGATVVVRALAINKLPKKTFLALWGIAAIRLLIPFSVPSMFSAYSVIEHAAPAMRTGGQTPVANIFPVAPGRGMTTITNAAGTVASETSVSIWGIIWAVGAAWCFLFFTIAYIRCRREFQASLPILNDFAKDWIAANQIRRRITLRQSSRISAPLTYGVFRPVILMPKGTDWTLTKSLEYVLAHEYVHVRRLDAVTKLVLISALCIHWFNPLVWGMYILANRDLELSCDEAVVRLFGEKTKSAYARTLIRMEETKSGLAPLCNSFSKNAIEERITAIMKMKKTSWIAILVAVTLVAGIAVAFATSANSSSNSLKPVSNTPFTDAEYDQLFALQLDGYEDMTVFDFQTRVWTLLDTAEYRNLLERFSQDETLYGIKDRNETASFLFNVLEPLTAERWQSREFGGYVATDYEAADNAMLEYWLTMEILDADTLTVRQYNHARLGAVHAISAILQEMSLDELKVDQSETIQTKMNQIAQDESSNGLRLSIRFVFSPLSGEASNLPASDTDGIDVDAQEPRQYGYGTEEDYASLLSLMTPGYQRMTVADFNAAVLEWGNEHFDGWERIREDAARNDDQVVLSEEERSFATLTVMLSGEENFRRIQSSKTGRPQEDPVVGGVNLTKEVDEGGYAAWCNLYYQLPYHVVDEEKLTVGERDRAIGGMINAVQTFWEETSLDDLLSLTQSDVLAKMALLADAYSSDLITINMDKAQIQFEGMDERGLNLD